MLHFFPLIPSLSLMKPISSPRFFKTDGGRDHPCRFLRYLKFTTNNPLKRLKRFSTWQRNGFWKEGVGNLLELLDPDRGFTDLVNSVRRFSLGGKDYEAHFDELLGTPPPHPRKEIKGSESELRSRVDRLAKNAILLNALFTSSAEDTACWIELRVERSIRVSVVNSGLTMRSLCPSFRG